MYMEESLLMVLANRSFFISFMILEGGMVTLALWAPLTGLALPFADLDPMDFFPTGMSN